jgi:RimJ/RimL family protein N-acetyltransferase
MFSPTEISTASRVGPHPNSRHCEEASSSGPAAFSPDGRERWLNWVIRERCTGRALGTLQATVRTEAEKPVTEVAWVLGVRAQGRGYASESAHALVAFLRGMGVQEVVAHIHPEHDASARVASAIGMQPTEEWSAGERLWRLQSP